VTPWSRTRDWDAAAYDRLSDWQLRMGIEVLDRLPLGGDETVLDAGCGTGRVTEVLLERLPGGCVIAVDGSPSMVEKAREKLPPEVEVRLADLTELELDDQVDVVFSNAVFHWIGDHDNLFRRLYAALRPGGRLLAQCGGEGNLDVFHEIVLAVASEGRFAEHLADWAKPWNFSSPERAAASLEAAGFVEVDCGLERRDLLREEPRSYLAGVCLGAHLDKLPDDLRDPFIETVLERIPEPLTLDYVRLNISGRRP
jgi:trans-aconitate 2-methyltransferase